VERRWIPLIDLWSGLRLEEICQLRHTDLREIDGSWCSCTTAPRNTSDRTTAQSSSRKRCRTGWQGSASNLSGSILGHPGRMDTMNDLTELCAMRFSMPSGSLRLSRLRSSSTSGAQAVQPHPSAPGPEHAIASAGNSNQEWHRTWGLDYRALQKLERCLAIPPFGGKYFKYLAFVVNRVDPYKHLFQGAGQFLTKAYVFLLRISSNI
jgi:hypothetical protein